jgi:hypothetical protein
VACEIQPSPNALEFLIPSPLWKWGQNGSKNMKRCGKNISKNKTTRSPSKHQLAKKLALSNESKGLEVWSLEKVKQKFYTSDSGRVFPSILEGRYTLQKTK